MSDLALSVVIPAYNEALRLPPSLERLRAYLTGHGGSYEVLVIDDGSRDGTAEAARAVAWPELQVLVNDSNRGKGYSVRRGMLAARGRRRLMTDADLSTPIEELARLEACLDAGRDVAIGSRAVPGSQVLVHQAGARELSGRAFNLLVRLLALPDLHDTQCGFKLFTAEAAVNGFEPARLDGFAFDVEVLLLARRAGARLAEVPVVWRNDAASRVSARKGARAFADVIGLRLALWTGRYGSIRRI